MNNKLKIFDSNIWISYLIKEDSNHKKAIKIFEKSKNEIIYITEYIIIEITTILLQKLGKEKTNLFIKICNNNKDVKNIHMSQLLFNKFLSFFTKNNFKKLSFIDQSLLYLSRDFEIITFDKEINKALKNL